MSSLTFRFLLTTFVTTLPFHPTVFADQAPNGTDEELGSSDLSILVPLQSYPTDDLSSSVFDKSGTGMCNAPTLDLDGLSNVISEEMWQEWAKDTLMSVLPLPPSSAAWKDDRSGSGFGDVIQKLKLDMNALPAFDGGSDELCAEPVGIDRIRNDDVDTLRNLGTHVAITQTLPAGACRYKNWRIVAARFEPCSFRASVHSKDPHALNPAKSSEFPESQCGGAELRLIIQPFISNGDGGYSSVDMAMHAFYKLENVSQLIADLRLLRRATRLALESSLSKKSGSVWYADQKNLLIPHPGLREEMDCESVGAKMGPVGTEWRRILSKYASEDKLFKLAWMTADNSGANWSFGLRLVQPAEGTLTPRQVTRLESFKVETFSISQVSKGFPFTPFELALNSVDYFYRDGRADKTLESPEAKVAVKELIAIADPDKTSFNVGGKMGASCASCHTRDQTEKAVRARSGKTHEQLAALADSKVWTIPLWDPIKKSIEKRNDNNLRNFGYGPAMTFGVSRRAVQEAEALRLLVAGFPDLESTSLTPQAPIQGSRGLKFADDILPILKSRCGYCHDTKRAPTLLKEGTAVAYANSIIRNICSNVLAFKHMPPGKVLPTDEQRKVLAWAGYDSCAEVLDSSN